MNKPKVSVIIPVYNGAHFIEKAVESVQNSTFKDFEIILINDGSKDESKQLCVQIVKQYKNVRFFPFTRNRGLSHSLNFALSKARGKYIARLNQDDTMTKTRLEKQVKFLDMHPDYVVLGGKVQLIDISGKIIDVIHPPTTDEAIRKSWLILCPFYDPDVMFRKSAYLKTSGYDQSFYPADDYHMWFRMGKLGKMANLNEVVTKVLIHDKAATLKSIRLLIKKTWKLHLWSAKNIASPSLPVYLFWVCQYLLGMIIPVQIIFAVYLFLRKFFYFKSLLTKNIFNKTAPDKLKIHPKILSISGQ